MLLSMTGFGRAVLELPKCKLTVEIKSLNSKQLDVAMRIPPIYREKELEIRNLLSSRLERGKVDLTVYRESTGVDDSVKLNVAALAGYKAQISEASRQLGIPEPEDWFAVLMRFPDVIHSEAAPTLNESESEGLMKVCGEAIDALMEFRATEGARLNEFFGKRLDAISELLDMVPRYETERVSRISARIEENLSKVPVAEYDRGRLEQEMIYYIEKLDINEEKQRLAQHIRYFAETMSGKASQGKKLGFITQEMGREINTLGSKSNHAELQRIVVKMKDELEQIKEQVLNVM